MEIGITLYERLAEPFPVESIHWRVGSTNKKFWKEGEKRRGKPLAYLDARDVMDRLDFVCGADGWQDEYPDAGNQATCCRIGVRMLEGDSEYWIWKADGAGQTDFEGAKGQFSDAFKRAAVKHGIGRYLYGCDSPWIELDERWGIPKTAIKGLTETLSKAGNRQLWGDRSAYTTFRLLKESLRKFVKEPQDITEFIAENQGHIEQLRVGAKREFDAEITRLTEQLGKKAA